MPLYTYTYLIDRTHHHGISSIACEQTNQSTDQQSRHHNLKRLHVSKQINQQINNQIITYQMWLVSHTNAVWLVYVYTCSLKQGQQ